MKETRQQNYRSRSRTRDRRRNRFAAGPARPAATGATTVAQRPLKREIGPRVATRRMRNGIHVRDVGGFAETTACSPQRSKSYVTRSVPLCRFLPRRHGMGRVAPSAQSVARPLEGASRSGPWSAVARAVDDLDIGMQDIFVAYYVLGDTLFEIAERTRRSPLSVEQALNRARQRIRFQFGSGGSVPDSTR